jgi:hypothetical protein
MIFCNFVIFWRLRRRMKQAAIAIMRKADAPMMVPAITAGLMALPCSG